MTIAVQRLGASARGALVTHFLALPADDRRLRFGSSLPPDRIAAYVDAIDFGRDAVFAVHDDRLRPVGVVHVAFGDDLAELGLSVLPAQRGLGIGGALFERAATHARNRDVRLLLMHCMAANGPIMRIARRSGMSIVTDSGDADAQLELPPASPASITGEFVTDRFAQYDHAIKVQAAAWAHLVRPATAADQDVNTERRAPCTGISSAGLHGQSDC
jgi:GNAT superfamily N-acetyltransferase